MNNNITGILKDTRFKIVFRLRNLETYAWDYRMCVGPTF